MSQATANSGIQRGEVVHGARAYLVLDGKPMGYVQGLDFGFQYDVQPLEVLDDLEVVEHVITGYRVTNVSAQVVELVSRNLYDMGLAVEQESVLEGRTFTLEVKDRPADKARYVLEEAMLTSASFSVRKGAPTYANCSMVAKRVRIDGRV